MADKPKKPHKADPTVAKAKKAIGAKLDSAELSVTDICELVTALAKLQQAERRQQEGDWGEEL